MIWRTSLSFALLFVFVFGAAAQSPEKKPTVSPADYGAWEKLGRGVVVSTDGTWLAVPITRVDRSFELRVHEIGGGEPQVIKEGRSPAFSNDGQWIAWSRGVSEEERERLEKEKKPVQNGAGLMELATGNRLDFDKVSRFAFDETGRFFALMQMGEKGAKGGATLLVHDLATAEARQAPVTFGNVESFKWSEVGSLLGLVLRTGEDRGNGIQLFDAPNGRLRSLDSSGSSYAALTWRKDTDDLSALRSVEVASKKSKAYTALAWRGLASNELRRFELDLAKIADGLELSRHGAPRWSKDGNKLALGLRPAEKKDDEQPEESKDEEKKKKKKGKKKRDLPGLQIWHSSDVLIHPQQKSRKGRDERRTMAAVWHLDSGKLAKVGTSLEDRAELLGNWAFAVERITAPYPWGKKFGRPYHDVYSVDVASGKRIKVAERVRRTWGSPAGRYLLTFDGKDYWTHELTSGERINITQKLKATFANTHYDTPTDQLPPHGVGGWLKDDAAVILYDRFDAWRVAPDGAGGTRITRGAKDELIHRVIDLDREEPAIDAAAPLYFSLRNERTEQRGFARLLPNEAVAKSLVLEDRQLSALAKAKGADVFVYRAEARDDSPDFFAAGGDLSSARQVTETNPQQDKYAWTKSALIDFKSEGGVDLQAALLYPANYDPARRYPMIVYTYEILAPQIHRYQEPDERRYYNQTVWTQEGYFVLMPDIIYRPRDPGVCAIESVRAAVAKIVDMGLVDKERVGLIGHSWGGYQATYLPTRTKIFAASVAGAPITNFVSFMGQIHWSAGMPEVSHWETGQGRMEVPLWKDPDAYRRNSPIHKVQDMETPLLMAFGDNDGTVDFDQGTEFYNFARRAGKHMVMLVYEGERHSFRKKPNQLDYHRRILEWFGHYLKGEPAPKWIIQGIAFKDHESEARRVAEKGVAGS